MGICGFRPEKLALQFQAAQPGQLHVEHQAPRRFGCSSRQKLSRRAIGLHPQTLRPQQPFDRLADGRIVIHYTNRGIDFTSWHTFEVK